MNTVRNAVKFCSILRITECSTYTSGRYSSSISFSKLSSRKFMSATHFDTLCLSNLKSHPHIISDNRNVSNVGYKFSRYSTSANPEEEHTTPPLTKENAHTLVMKLTTDERNALMTVLREFESEQLKAEYKGQLAAFRWRSKFGRPSKMPSLGDVDPTGSYCPVPEDWLLRKYAETVPKPSTSQLIGVAVHNATPFVGFGFLDNFFMIICGDYIELTLGSFITITTMAAAALGNTLSDVLGIGSAFYVEWAVSKFGFRPPNLSPIQLDMNISRVASNLGRVIGVIVGCLLGMCPLLWKKGKTDTKEESPKEPAELGLQINVV